MEMTKKKLPIIEIAVAALLAVLVAVIVIGKLSSANLFAKFNSNVLTLRFVFYLIAGIAAICALVALIVGKFVLGKLLNISLSFGILSIAAFIMVVVNGLSLASEFETPGALFEDALFAMIYLVIAGGLFLLLAASGKPIYRIIIIGVMCVVFLAAMLLDYFVLMPMAARETNLFTIGDKIVVLLGLLAICGYELNLFLEGNKEEAEKEEAE